MMKAMAAAILTAASLAAVFAQDALFVDGVTFAHDPGTLYAPVRDLAEGLGLDIAFDPLTDSVTLNDVPVEDGPWLLEGRRLVAVRDLRELGILVEWSQDTEEARLSFGLRELYVGRGMKRVEIDKSEQLLRAFQGERVVLETRISTGALGHNTPNGEFTAGPIKKRMHYSSLYDNSPMPFSVQIVGNIFVHGYHSVPNRPASHGCIRMPLTGKNPAKWFYEWVEIGTPVTISGEWKNRR